MKDSMKNDVAMKEMPKYKCKKQVWAFKIKDLKPSETCENCENDGSYMMIPEEDVFAPVKLSRQFMNKHKPEVGGYYVLYKDGYKSYSPAKAFEEGYDKL